MKICSLLPSATEILFALGLGNQVVGVSHECDFPEEARSKKVLIHSRISNTHSAAAIDRQVREFLERGESLYSVDLAALAELDPDLIVTQDLCHVCAATPDDLAAALSHLPRTPKIVTLNPHSVADVCADIRMVADATHTCERAELVIADFERTIAGVKQAVAGLPLKRVVSLEWLDPPYVAGHWVPEMVAVAGGVDVLAHAEKPSFRVEWLAILETKPDVIVIMPCGYTLQQAMDEYQALEFPPGWDALPAVKEGRVFVVEASGYFSRPGPRLAEGVALLADAMHGTELANRAPTGGKPLFARAGIAKN